MDDVQQAVVHPLDEVVRSRKQEIWFRIATLHESMSDHDSAFAALEKVISINPSHTAAVTKAGTLLLFKNNYRRAANFLQTAISQQTENVTAWAALAHCYVMTDDLSSACQAYHAAISHSTDLRNPLLWYGIANLYDRVGLLDKALDAFDAVLQMAPMHPRRLDIYCTMALIHKERHNYDHALTFFKKITVENTDPNTYSNAMYHIAHLHELRSDSKTAMDAYTNALARNPNHIKCYHGIAWLLHKAGKTDQAAPFLQRAVQLNPADAYTHYVMGRIAMTSKDYRVAYDSYQQAVYRDSKNPLFWCAIGVLYFHMQQHRDAMDAFTRAIHIDPTMPQVWHDMGILYEIYQQFPDAVDAYRRAVRLNPNNTETSRRLTLLEQVIATGATQSPHPPPMTPDTDGPPVSPRPESTMRPHLSPDVLSRYPPFPALPRAQLQPVPATNGPHALSPPHAPVSRVPSGERIPSAVDHTANGLPNPSPSQRPVRAPHPVPSNDPHPVNSVPQTSAPPDFSQPRSLPMPVITARDRPVQRENLMSPPVSRPGESAPVAHVTMPSSPANLRTQQTPSTGDRAPVPPVPRRVTPPPQTQPDASSTYHPVAVSQPPMVRPQQASPPRSTPLPQPRPYLSPPASQPIEVSENPSQRSHPSQHARGSPLRTLRGANFPPNASPDPRTDRRHAWYPASAQVDSRPNFNRQYNPTQEDGKQQESYRSNGPSVLSAERPYQERPRDESEIRRFPTEHDAPRLSSPNARDNPDGRTANRSENVTEYRRSPGEQERMMPSASGEMSKRSVSSSLEGKLHRQMSNERVENANRSPNAVPSVRTSHSGEDLDSAGRQARRGREDGSVSAIPLNSTPAANSLSSPVQARRMRSPENRTRRSPHSGEKSGRHEVVDEEMLPVLRPLPMSEATIRGGAAVAAAGSSHPADRNAEGPRMEGGQSGGSRGGEDRRSASISGHDRNSPSQYDRRASGGPRLSGQGIAEPDAQRHSGDSGRPTYRTSRSSEGVRSLPAPQGEGSARNDPGHSSPIAGMRHQRSPAGSRLSGGDREYGSGAPGSLRLLRSVPMDRLYSDRRNDHGRGDPQAGGTERHGIDDRRHGPPRRDEERNDSRYDSRLPTHSRRNSFDSAGGHVNGSSGRDEDRRKSYDFSTGERRRDGPVSPGRRLDRYRERAIEMTRGGHGEDGDNVPFGSGAPTSFSKSLSRAGASSGLATSHGSGTPNGIRADGYNGRYHDEDRMRRESPHDSEESPRGRKRRYHGGRRYSEADHDRQEHGGYVGGRMEMENNESGRDGQYAKQDGSTFSRVSPGPLMGNGRGGGAVGGDVDDRDNIDGRRPLKRLRGHERVGSEGVNPRLKSEEVKTSD